VLCWAHELPTGDCGLRIERPREWDSRRSSLRGKCHLPCVRCQARLARTEIRLRIVRLPPHLASADGGVGFKNMKITKQTQFIFEACCCLCDTCNENGPKTKSIYPDLNVVNPCRRGCNPDGRRENPEHNARNRESFEPQMNTIKFLIGDRSKRRRGAGQRVEGRKPMAEESARSTCREKPGKLRAVL